MSRHWTIRGSGDYELLLEHGHRERRLELALKQRLDAVAVPAHLVAGVQERIERHLASYQRIMAAAGLYELSTPAKPLVIDRATWEVVAA